MKFVGEWMNDLCFFIGVTTLVLLSTVGENYPRMIKNL